MLESAANTTLHLFAQRLVAEELMPIAVAEQATSEAKSRGMPFIHFLEHEKIVDSALLASVASRFYGLSLYDLSVHDQNLIPPEFIELDIVKKHFGIPIIKEPEKLIVAVADPEIPELREIGFITGLKTEFCDC